MSDPQDAPSNTASCPDRRGILVVDDDPDQASELVDLFRDAGFTVGSAIGASQAMEMLGTQRPRLMLVDLRMPGIDGLRLARLVQGLDHRVAIILMSGDWDAVEEVRGRDDAILAVVPKPLDLTWLLETARALIH
ncbi:response regulator [Hyphomonas sp.]|jgi:DNA-binding response OmpR family regulator|uniref:response regulator n=1 Tax=Hyphomonas sp. TaxID=87 RepID=UPI0037C0D72F